MSERSPLEPDPYEADIREQLAALSNLEMPISLGWPTADVKHLLATIDALRSVPPVLSGDRIEPYHRLGPDITAWGAGDIAGRYLLVPWSGEEPLRLRFETAHVRVREAPFERFVYWYVLLPDDKAACEGWLRGIAEQRGIKLDPTSIGAAARAILTRTQTQLRFMEPVVRARLEQMAKIP